MRGKDFSGRMLDLTLDSNDLTGFNGFDALIHGEENVEFACFRSGKKVAILQSCQSSITGCLAIVAGQRVPKSLIDTLVDQNAHLGAREQKVFCFFESSDGHLTRDGRKPLQKVFECLSALQIVEQRLDRHARTAKHRSSTKDIRVRDNDSHGMILSPGWPRGGLTLAHPLAPCFRRSVRDPTSPLGEDSGVIHSQSCTYKFTIDKIPDP